MKLPHELTQDKAASFALSWSVTWRVILVLLVVTTLFDFVPPKIQIEYSTPFIVLNILIMFLLIWLWIHKILKSGIGRVKIIFMEEKHYDELVAKTHTETEI